jgi:hypothetical protein
MKMHVGAQRKNTSWEKTLQGKAAYGSVIRKPLILHNLIYTNEKLEMGRNHTLTVIGIQFCLSVPWFRAFPFGEGASTSFTGFLPPTTTYFRTCQDLLPTNPCWSIHRTFMGSFPQLLRNNFPEQDNPPEMYYLLYYPCHTHNPLRKHGFESSFIPVPH